MTWYSVHIETVGDEPDEEAMERLLVALSEISDVTGPVVGGADVRLAPGPSAAFSVEARDAAAATSLALERFEKAIATAGLSIGDVVRADVMTEDFQERWLGLMPEELMGVAEVAEKLGVVKQRVDQLRSKPGFPAPAAELASGPVWRASTLERFIQGWSRRPGRPPTVWKAEFVIPIQRGKGGPDVVLQKILEALPPTAFQRGGSGGTWPITVWFRFPAPNEQTAREEAEYRLGDALAQAGCRPPSDQMEFRLTRE